MKKQGRIRTLVREVINLITKFFKSYGLNDEILSIPKNVRLEGLKVGSMSLIMTIIDLLFAFMLKITNMAIEYKFILLWILLFMLYRGQRVVREAFHLFENSEKKKFELIFDDEIVLRASKIIGKTADKVLKYDIQNNLYIVMSNESVLNTISNYLKNLWRQKIRHPFDILEMISVIVMLIVAVVTNTAISQFIFIPLIIIFLIISRCV